MKLRRALLLGLAFAVSSCQIILRQEEGGNVAKNECHHDSDCGDGLCRNGMCVAFKGDFDTLLLSITPPTDASGVGGVRYLSVTSGLARTNQDFLVDLPPVSRVTGFFTAPNSGCTPVSTGTVPVEVTLTPSESSYGLPSVSLLARTGDPGAPSGACASLNLTGSIYEFVVDAPAGSYDVYVRPLVDPAAATTTSCVPQLIRGFTVSPAADQCRPLALVAPEMLAFQILPPTGTLLDGWTVDMVHPITGSRISNPIQLGGVSTLGTYSASLAYSHDTTLRPGKEIVRITPPDGVYAPTLYFEVSGLVATTAAQTPPLGLFPDPVAIEPWVWSEKDLPDKEISVTGSVTFTARSLLGVAPGVVASYTTTVQSDGTNPIQATLLPGTYRVRIQPQAGLGYAATETEIEVPCERDPNALDQCLPGTGVLSPTKPPLAGGILLVKKAASVTGVLAEPVHGDRIDGAFVQVAPAVLAEARCDADSGTCPSRPLHIFDTILGQDAFVPRAATTLSDHGTFVLPEVDCGGCTAGSGALFDLTGAPPDGSRLPWIVHPSLTVDGGRVDLGLRKGSLPIVQWGTVEIPRNNQGAVPVPRALVRAYLLRDQNGNAVNDPTTPSCELPSSGSAGTPTTPCIRSALQIAEARGREDGTFELILPSSFDTAP